jgi:prevent-host-death family protein
MDKTLSLSEAKMKLNRLVEEVSANESEVNITKNGSPVAVLIPAALFEGWRETQVIKSDPDFLGEIARGIERLKRRRKRYSFEAVFGEPLK